MPEKQKVYCGTRQELPGGYARFATPYQCLKKGYGACLYAGRRGVGGGMVRNEQQFFNKLTNRLWFMFLLWVALVVLLWWMDRFFLAKE
jgi:hypothetical protein